MWGGDCWLSNSVFETRTDFGRTMDGVMAQHEVFRVYIMGLKLFQHSIFTDGLVLMPLTLLYFWITSSAEIGHRTWWSATSFCIYYYRKWNKQLNQTVSKLKINTFSSVENYEQAVHWLGLLSCSTGSRFHIQPGTYRHGVGSMNHSASYITGQRREKFF